MNEKSAAELEREAEAVRARVADTAESLRNKMTPGQMIDEFTGMVSGGDTGAAFRNMKNQVRDNPLPLALVGVGLAWLMLGSGPSASRIRSATSSRFGSRSDFHDDEWNEEEWDDEAWDDEVAASNFGPASDVYGSSRDRSARQSSGDGSGNGHGESLMGKVSGAASSAMSAAGDAISGARDTLSDAGHRAGRTAGHMGSGVGGLGRKAGRYGKSMGRGIYSGSKSIGRAGRRVSHTTGDMVEREPLWLAAFGLAAGAAIGALIPRTSYEDEYLGEYGRQLRHSGEDLLERGVDEVKDVASEAYQAAKDEADRQGLSPTGENSLADKVASVARAAAGTTEEAVREKTGSASDKSASATSRSDEARPGWSPS